MVLIKWLRYKITSIATDALHVVHHPYLSNHKTVNQMTLSPIVLFVYNRPWHTQQTIEALQNNELASESELFIYSDAAKNETAQQAVDEVRAYIKSIAGFKKVTIIEREKNWGLANSIIDGVTSIINQYGKIIVLEDDIVTSPYFLKYMNDALTIYDESEKVWHVSGRNIQIKNIDDNNAFLWRMMECWGWATWENKWKYFDKELMREECKTMSPEEIYAFNLDDYVSYYDQIVANIDKKINTWAVFWYATIFKNKGLCLSPYRSLIANIGLDGTGVHCGNESNKLEAVLGNRVFVFPTRIEENEEIVSKIKSFYKKKRMVNKLKSKVKMLHHKTGRFFEK